MIEKKKKEVAEEEEEKEEKEELASILREHLSYRRAFLPPSVLVHVVT